MTQRYTLDGKPERKPEYANRRTALAMLGFGGTAAAVMGSEAFAMPPEEPGEIQSSASAYNKERYAKALENLAAELRADRVAIVNLNLASSIEAHNLADVHTLRLEFIYKPEL